MTLRVGVVGAGAHSNRQHGPALKRCATDDPSIRLAAVCDVNAERARRYAERFGFQGSYTDVDRMCDSEDLDAIIAVSPTEKTHSLVGDLLRRGLPTLIEKPPGRTIEETRDLQEIAVENDTPHMISFNRRFNPAVVRAREFLTTRPSPQTVIARLHRVGRLEPDHVFNTGIHAVDLACSFLSSPQRVVSHRWQPSENGGEPCEALIECTKEDTATISLAPNAGSHKEVYEIVGPQYTITIDVATPTVTGFGAGESELQWSIEDDAPTCKRVGALAETEGFLDAVRGDRRFGPDLHDGLETIRTVSAIDAGGQHEL